MPASSWGAHELMLMRSWGVQRIAGCLPITVSLPDFGAYRYIESLGLLVLTASLPYFDQTLNLFQRSELGILLQKCSWAWKVGSGWKIFYWSESEEDHWFQELGLYRGKQENFRCHKSKSKFSRSTCVTNHYFIFMLSFVHSFFHSFICNKLHHTNKPLRYCLKLNILKVLITGQERTMLYALTNSARIAGDSGGFDPLLHLTPLLHMTRTSPADPHFSIWLTWTLPVPSTGSTGAARFLLGEFEHRLGHLLIKVLMMIKFWLSRIIHGFLFWN